MHHPAIHMHDGTKILRTIISNIRDIRQPDYKKVIKKKKTEKKLNMYLGLLTNLLWGVGFSFSTS